MRSIGYGLMAGFMLGLGGCGESVVEDNSSKVAVVKRVDDKFPDNLYVNDRFHRFVDVRDENGQIRGFKNELLGLEDYLSSLGNNDFDREEVLRIRTLMVQGYYLKGYFDNDVDANNREDVVRARNLANEIWQENRDYAIKRNDFYTLMLSKNKSYFKRHMEDGADQIENEADKFVDENEHAILPGFNGVYWINSKPLTNEDVKGKVVLYDFWATWCGPCVEELPSLKKLYKNHKDEGLIVIGVHTPTKNTFDLEQFIQRYDIRFPIVVSDDETMERYEITTIPRKLVIDRKGRKRDNVLLNILLDE